MVEYPNQLALTLLKMHRDTATEATTEVELDDDLIDILSKGESAIFVVFKTPEEGIGIPVSLEGFSEGFADGGRVWGYWVEV